MAIKQWVRADVIAETEAAEKTKLKQEAAAKPKEKKEGDK